MTPQEIQERNKQIALMLGFKYKNQAKYWSIYPLDDNSFLSKLGYVMMCNLKFHSDWNWLMEAVEFIRRLGWNYDISSPIASLKESSLFECDFWNKNNHDINRRSLNSQKEAVFIAVSDFAKLMTSQERGANGGTFLKERNKELPQLGTKEFNDLAASFFGGNPQQNN
jgi:hypothetical protein